MDREGLLVGLTAKMLCYVTPSVLYVFCRVEGPKVTAVVSKGQAVTLL